MPQDDTAQSSLNQLIHALCNPEVYPHPVDMITTIETHISVVFLTGDYAYKLKKPVNFGFLDFTELSEREKFCQKELVLNRRTAPELYIEVVQLYQNGSVYSFTPVEAKQKPVECLVKMLQFDPNQVLGRLVNKVSITAPQIEKLVSEISKLHLSAQTVDKDSVFGEPDTILQPMLDNLLSLRQFFTEHPELNRFKQELNEIESWTLNQFTDLKPCIQKRKALGFIKSCHGDLHLDNIALVNDTPLLFDAIEFNDHFSQIDVISDLSFLLIDLEYREQEALSRLILSHYLHYTQDYAALKLLRFYKVYRSMVRAKISALQAAQNPKPSLKFQTLTQKTIGYLHLANKQKISITQPKLILIQGVSGSGKSHSARKLLEFLDAIILSSDRTRKKLFGITPEHRVADDEKSRLYSAEMSQKTYQKLYENAQIILQNGWHAIIDATLLKKSHRIPFYQLAQERDCPVYLICIKTDSMTAQLSIQKRLQANLDPSDADEQIMQKQMQIIEYPEKDEHALTLQADDIRNLWPEGKIKEFLNLPIT